MMRRHDDGMVRPANYSTIRAQVTEMPGNDGPMPEPPVKAPTILVVEDDAPLRSAACEVLDASGYRVFTVANGARALQVLQQQRIDVVITDLDVRGPSREQLLTEVREKHPEVAVVTMTALGSVDRANASSRDGAVGRMRKPLDLTALPDTVAAVLARAKPGRQRGVGRPAGGEHLRGIIGRSRAMKQLFEQISRIAPSSVPVLINGETGSGKELVARALHLASGRKRFVPVNCSAIPAGLLESELFGHVRGAFTGADRDRLGLFEAAHEGTIFLDEIAELPLGLQAKLLRVLQSGELRRVGDVQPRHVTVRLIAATHRDLTAAVDAGTFREDLFYRINVLHLSVPPLRGRPTDIPLLADAFLQQIAARDKQPAMQFSPGALAHLIAYSWPGNVRQLRNVVERTAVLSESTVIEVEDLPPEICSGDPVSPALGRVGTEVTLAEIEREHIIGVLMRVGGNRSRAAKILGLPRRTLYRRLDEYGLRGEEE
jgi:DNA-binding NtrC family response regulator